MWNCTPNVMIHFKILDIASDTAPQQIMVDGCPAILGNLGQLSHSSGSAHRSIAPYALFQEDGDNTPNELTRQRSLLLEWKKVGFTVGFICTRSLVLPNKRLMLGYLVPSGWLNGGKRITVDHNSLDMTPILALLIT